MDSTRTKIVKREEVAEDIIRRCARLYVRGILPSFSPSFLSHLCIDHSFPLRSLFNFKIVVEARRLPKALTGSSTSSYCIVDLADQQVRTQTIWKTREPMWCEEFYL